MGEEPHAPETLEEGRKIMAKEDWSFDIESIQGIKAINEAREKADEASQYFIQALVSSVETAHAEALFYVAKEWDESARINMGILSDDIVFMLGAPDCLCEWEWTGQDKSLKELLKADIENPRLAMGPNVCETQEGKRELVIKSLRKIINELELDQ